MMTFTGSAVILGLLMLSTLPGIVFSNGNWNHCPENITAYRDCSTSNVTIYALFKTNNFQSCDNGYVYHIHIRESGSGLQFNDKFGPNDPVPPVIVEGTNGTICNISVTDTITQLVGVYDIQFLVTFGPNLIPQECEDHLFVRDTIPSPLIATISVTCEGVHIEWEGPELADGFDIFGYTLAIPGTNIVYNTTNTSIHIPYSAGLEYHKQYNISIVASYCGGIGNSTTGRSFYTAIAPTFLDQIFPLENITRNAASNMTVLNLVEISDTDCKASYPSPSMTCIITMNCSSGYSLSNVTAPVVFGSDGSIWVDLVLPFDTLCLAKFTFLDKKLSFAVSIDHTFTDLNQLQSCSFITTCQNGIIVICHFADFSVLRGCQAIAAGINTNRSYTSNRIIAATSNAHGLISGVTENGEYEVRCLGLVEYNGSISTVTYQDNPSHVSVVSVINSISVTVGPQFCIETPSIQEIEEGSSSIYLFIFIPAIILLVIIIVVICAILAVRRCTLRKGGNNEPSWDEPSGSGTDHSLEHNEGTESMYSQTTNMSYWNWLAWMPDSFKWQFTDQ